MGLASSAASPTAGAAAGSPTGVCSAGAGATVSGFVVVVSAIVKIITTRYAIEEDAVVVAATK